MLKFCIKANEELTNIFLFFILDFAISSRSNEFKSIPFALNKI